MAVKAIIDYIDIKKAAPKNTDSIIATWRVKNVSETPARVWGAFEELKNDGSVKESICNDFIQTLAPGECASYCGNQRVTGECYGKIGGSCDSTRNCNNIINKPAGTYYYGVKTWIEDEVEPSYPIPDSLNQPADAMAWSVIVGALIECNKPTPNFSSGCELLLAYDKDYDGQINLEELNQSFTDFENGIITNEEWDFVSDAYINGGINVVCPGCGKAPPKKTVTFESVPNDASVEVVK